MASASTPDRESPKNDSEQSLGPSSESSTKQWDSDADNTESPATAGSPKRATSTVLLLAGILIVADQASKTWALRALTDDQTIDVALGAQFKLHFNPGAAFSTGTALGPLFGVAAVIVSIWLVTFARKHQNKAVSIVAGLVVGGALGNVIDRAFRRGDGGFLGGFVVDFIDLGWWPVFNVADMAIVIGVITMMLLLIRNPDL